MPVDHKCVSGESEFIRILYYLVYGYVWKVQDQVLLGQKHVQ